MSTCRSCRHEESTGATTCPHCGSPLPVRAPGDGWGYEYQSSARLLGLPVVHISFRYRANRAPVVARGVLAIGQFACGIITFAQFGVGVVSISQFTVAAFAIAQFAAAYSLVAQMGVYLHEGHGQVVRSVAEILRLI